MNFFYHFAHKNFNSTSIFYWTTPSCNISPKIIEKTAAGRDNASIRPGKSIARQQKRDASSDFKRAGWRAGGRENR